MYGILGALLVQVILAALRNRMQKETFARDYQNDELGPLGGLILLVCSLLTLLIVRLAFAGSMHLLLLFLPLSLFAFPWPLATRTAVPLGLPRLAYFWASLSDHLFSRDRKGGAALAAAWALLKQRTVDEQALAWVEAKLTDARPLGGAGILASGLLLSLRGDDEGARQIIASVVTVDPRACPNSARRLARSFLMADAAARGQWAPVAELGRAQRRDGPRSAHPFDRWAYALSTSGRETWLLTGVSAVLLSEAAAPQKLGLWARWALAPRRLRTLPIVKRAIAVQEGSFPSASREPRAARVVPEASSEAREPLSLSLAQHAALLTRPLTEVTGEQVCDVAQAWDAVLYGRAAERAMEERAIGLGGADASTALTRLRAAVEEDLTALILATGFPLPRLDDEGHVIARIRRRVRDQRLRDVETASDALRRRIDDKRALPAVDEWREWTALRRCYEEGARLCGEEFRRLAFYKVHPDACSLAVWLYNEREQRPIANAIFRFLLDEATVLDDTRAIALQTKNVACGL